MNSPVPRNNSKVMAFSSVSIIYSYILHIKHNPRHFANTSNYSHSIMYHQFFVSAQNYSVL